MWTEIYGKLPSQWGRREDLLTGNFFGLLQFASQNSGILHQILKGVQFCLREDATDEIGQKGLNAFNEFLADLLRTREQPNFSFWKWEPNKEGGRDEIDLIIDFPGLKYILGIEVKYLSYLSSNDIAPSSTEQEKTPEVKAEEAEESRNQLLRYARTFSKKGGKNKTCFFVIWATDAMAVEIFEGITTIEKQQAERNTHSKSSIHLGFMTWEKTAEQLAGMITPLVFPDSKIRADLHRYLESKNLAGFSAFKDIPSKRIFSKPGFLFEPFDFQFTTSKIEKHLHYEFN